VDQADNVVGKTIEVAGHVTDDEKPESEGKLTGQREKSTMQPENAKNAGYAH
jgi:uncharacterized protein YjbJ (UPF0337 family)